MLINQDVFLLIYFQQQITLNKYLLNIKHNIHNRIKEKIFFYMPMTPIV